MRFPVKQSFLFAAAIAFAVGSQPGQAAPESDAQAALQSGPGVPPESGAGSGTETRPVLSAINAVDEALLSAARIRSLSHDLIYECDRKASSSTLGFEEGKTYSSGPLMKPKVGDGDYLPMRKFKLAEISGDLQRQHKLLVEWLGRNMQDKRELRASESAREKVKGLKPDARASFDKMAEANGRVIALLVAGNPPRAELKAAAEDLRVSSDRLKDNLSRIEKVLKKEK